MNLVQLAGAVAIIGLGLHIIFTSWRGEPPAHVAAGLMGVVMGAFGLAADNSAVTAICGLHAGWQFACAYMVHVGQPHVVRVRFYLDEDGQWVQSEHPSKYREHG